MKTLPLIAAALGTLFTAVNAVFAQGTAFTYQGQLTSAGGTAVAGLYDFQFAVFDSPGGGTQIGSTIVTNAVGVTNGLFTVTLDFGANIFTGNARWLDLAAHTNNSPAAFVSMTPRQQLTATPYAVLAGSLSPSAQVNISGVTVSGGQNNSISSGVVDSFIGAGQNNTNQSTLSFVGGGNNNLIAANAADAFIGGGSLNTVSGQWAANLGGVGNTASGVGSITLGGLQNLAGGTASFAAGYQAQATNASSFVWADAEGTPFISTSNNQFNVRANGGVRFVTGGAGMTVDGQAVATIQLNNSVVSGGQNNSIQTGALDSFIGGGSQNTVSNQWSADIGGVGNIAGGVGSVTLGGFQNVASGNFSLAAGYRAQAANQGSFVWADSQGSPFASTNNDSFNVRAQGGVHLVTSGAGMTVDGPINGSITVQQNTNGAPNIIEGASVNYVSNSVVGATIGGGGTTYDKANGYSYSNSVTGDFGTVGGGLANTANFRATVSGGYQNASSGYFAAIGGGFSNIAGDDATVAGGGDNNASGQWSTVGGGEGNNVYGLWSTIGGGQQNNVWQSQFWSTIGGGFSNTVTTTLGTIGGGAYNVVFSTYGTIPGGFRNVVLGVYSFAAGQQATAIHQGAFVWADSQNAQFFSTANDEFSVRATGGVRFVTAIDGTGNPTAGVSLASGSGSWSSLSDRNAKKDFSPVDSQTVLAQVAALPMTTWSYKSESGVRHIGPMAQDFHAAFRVGEDERHITEIDESGVALAAIQGLNDKLKEKDTEIEELKARLDALEKMVRNQK